MTLKVCLFRGEVSFISRAIEWETRSPYCHAALLFEDAYFESIEGPGVRKLPGLPAGETVDLFTVTGLTAAGTLATRNWCESKVGTPYNWPGVLAILERDYKDEDRGAMFCSEFDFLGIEVGGVSVLLRKPPFRIEPGDLGISPLLNLWT